LIKSFDLFFAKWAIEDHPRQGTNFSLPAGNYKRFIFVKYIRDKAKANYIEEKEIVKRWKKYKEKQMREISIYLDKIHDYSRKDIRCNIKNSMLGKDFLIPEVELKVTATTKYKKGEKPIQRKYKRSFSNDYGL